MNFPIKLYIKGIVGFIGVKRDLIYVGDSVCFFLIIGSTVRHRTIQVRRVTLAGRKGNFHFAIGEKKYQAPKIRHKAVSVFNKNIHFSGITPNGLL